VPTPLRKRLPQLAVFTMMGIGLATAIAGRIGGPRPVDDTGSVVVSRDLRFNDREDGAVVVTDARTEQTVDVLTGEQGFIRSTMRGLARARHSEGLGPAAPFRLTAWTDGRLTLDDATTGRHLELQAFGPLNAVVFARLLNLAPRIEQAVHVPGPAL